MKQIAQPYYTTRFFGRSLSWWPLKRAPTKNMYVKMIDRLPTIFSVVCDQSKAAGKALGSRHVLSNLKEPVPQLIAPIQRNDAGNVRLRRHQYVNRSLRVDVPECNDKLSFRHPRSGNLAARNTAKDAGIAQPSTPFNSTFYHNIGLVPQSRQLCFDWQKPFSLQFYNVAVWKNRFRVAAHARPSCPPLFTPWAHQGPSSLFRRPQLCDRAGR
jgi:hypothetical protein